MCVYMHMYMHAYICIHIYGQGHVKQAGRPYGFVVVCVSSLDSTQNATRATHAALSISSLVAGGDPVTHLGIITGHGRTRQ